MHATSEVGIPADGALLRGDLTVPESAIGVVAFAHVELLARTWFVRWLGEAAGR